MLPICINVPPDIGLQDEGEQRSLPSILCL
jgi:hypothetical protein